MKMRKNYTSGFKAKLVLEVIQGERTLNEIASANGVHPTVLTRWKTEAVKNLQMVFENENIAARKVKKENDAKVDELYREIGKLTTENAWLKKKSGI
jgi:transposase-like protein